MEFSINKLRLELKYIWKISRNSSTYKVNYIVTIKENNLVAHGEVAPNSRYNETTETIEKGFEQFLSVVGNSSINYLDLAEIFNKIKIPNALKFGIEQACINLFCLKNRLNLAGFLKVNAKQQAATCYTLPIMDAADVIPFFNQYNLQRFKYLKVKVGSTNQTDMLNELFKVYNGKLMIDGNEAWTNPDDVMMFEESIDKSKILFIEQPMPALHVDEYVYLKKHLKLPIIADESCLDIVDFSLIKQQFSGINVKLMKAGGILNGLHLINEAKKHNLITMIGCMVETTLAMHAAWVLASLTNYADLDGYMIISNEPFCYLAENDGMVCESGINVRL